MTETQLSLELVNAPTVPLAADVLKFGRPVASRYGPSLELIGGQFEMLSGGLIERQGINWSLGWMELLQFVAGTYDLSAIKRVAPKANHSLFTYEMAYGPRIYDQMIELLHTLSVNPETRQAVLFIGKPEDGPTSCLPCTLTMQFLIRDGRLNGVVSMRSWDLCRGLPYDIMMFSGLLKIVARCLEIPDGLLIVTAGSAHVYQDQMDKLPCLSSTRWRFTEDAPTSWIGFVGWAVNNILYLKKGGRPGCIEYFSGS